ncbi:hypothetical protein SOASR014_41600 [Pectobacterium carotovorum subsp. carotovorum]|nr:hypothetical protein SOASR014_41600 [Pectobacterium carotovorum subsp. carotovorum]GLX46563.1 hypothetical protein Pcaca01_42310 [Pectobacterium carotovorum subsp. carotovorum]
MSSEQQVGNIVYQVEMNVARLIEAQRQVNDRLDRMEGGFNSTGRAAQNAERSFASLSRVAGALIAALSVQQVASYADAWTVLNNKVANSVKQGEQQADVMQRIFDISQATQSSLNGTATLYARLERGTRLLNTSSTDLAKLTTIINQGFAVSGATTQEAENAIVQLSQGLAAGALRGEEFNSVSEQGSRLMIALADSLGVSLGELRAMAAQGKLTNEIIVNGLLSQGDAIGKEFAKTTVSISQGLLVAGNNVTKFFGENSTVKSFSAAFRDSVISISENLDALSGALIIVASIVGSRYVGALAMATAEKVKKAIATREEIVAENQAAQAAANKTASDLRAAAITKERALDEVRLAQMMKNTSFSATSLAAAEVRLSVARLEAATLTDNYNRALAANAIAQDAAGAASARATISVGGLAVRALGLIGGPVGAAMLAAGAIFYFSQKAKEARDNANNLADSVNSLVVKFQAMSNTELASTIGKLSGNLPELSDAVADAQQEFDKATASVKFQQKELDNWGEGTRRGRQAAEALGGAQDRLAIAVYNLERAENRYSQTLSAINIGRSTLNGTMRQGIDLLRRDVEEAGVAAGMMNQLGKAMNFAAGAKEKFNATSLVVNRPKDIQDYLDGQQEQIDLQSQFNERKREQMKAELAIRNLAKKDTSIDPDQVERDVNLARERAGVSFDQKKAEEERRKEQQKGEQQDKKSASATESVAQKLANMKQQSELTADSTREMNREQAILTAQQSLGAAATQKDLQLAAQYAAKKWDGAAAIRAQAAAQKLIPETAENVSYQQDVSDLKVALAQKKITQQEYDTTAERMAQDHQDKLAQIRAGQAVTPQQQSAGLVDPVQALANENARKLALIQQFEQNKTLTEQQALALRNSLNTEYEQQRVAAQWEIWRNQSTGNEALAASFDALAGNASNAFTGILTGSMTAGDAMRSLGSTVLNSLVNTFVQMGVEWVKSAVMGAATQQAATVATTATSVAGVATTTAASTAAAATTTAAWTPAAIVASIGSFGGAAAIGIGAVLGALAMGVAGKRKNGGPVSAGGLYQVGEGGMPEIYQASNGRQYMIPGDNGSVISNKDLHGGSSTPNVSIQFIDQSTGRKSFDAKSSMDGNTLTVTGFISDMEEGGEMSQAITRNTTASRRANG